MSAKKSDFGLIIKLLVALAIGAFLGRMANVEVMDAVASVKYALGQIIFYAVPLVIVASSRPGHRPLGTERQQDAADGRGHRLPFVRRRGGVLGGFRATPSSRTCPCPRR